MRKLLHKKEIDIVLVALSSPIKIGLYENNILFKEIESYEKSSDFLPKIYKEISKNFLIKNIYYANGPGSFMSIKLAYIFLKTLQIVKNIDIKACDAFIFSKNRPIKAVGKLYFIKEDGKIVTKKFDKDIKTDFYLPKSLKNIEFSEDIEPLYILPAV